nr:hypothetical protein [Tanacetum cinerariifolium]
GDEVVSLREQGDEVKADDQAIQNILLGLPEDIYAVVDSCEIDQEIWLRVQQMMRGSDVGIQNKKAKLFNEWKRFTSIDGESIESYYHRFSKLMNDFKRNKHFHEMIAKDYTQLQKFLKYNQKENGGNQNGPIVVLGIANHNSNGNGNVVATWVEGNATGNIAEDFDLMAAVADLDEIEEVNANCILMLICSKHRRRVLRLTKLPSSIQTDQLRSIGTELPRPGSVTHMASGRISFEELRVFGKAPAGATTCD